MVCFIKVLIPAYFRESFLNNERLKFYDPSTTASIDGEVIYHKQYRFLEFKAMYKYLTITISKKGNIVLYGSIHKYWNDGNNSNDYSFNDIFETLISIENDLQIDLLKCDIQNIELSINLSDLPLITSDILKGRIGTKVSGGANFKEFEKQYAPPKGNYYRSERTEYNYKMYDKDGSFRFEIQFKKARTIYRATGVNTLYDLSDPTCQQRIMHTILKHWDNVILFDVALPKCNKYFKYRDVNFWIDISNNKDKLLRERKKLKDASFKEGSNIHKVIRIAIENKIEMMSTISR